MTLRRRIFHLATATPVGNALLHYGCTAIAVVATVLTLPHLHLGPAGIVVYIFVLAACAWFGGIGPALVAPFLMGVAHRWHTRGIGEALDLSFPALMFLAAFTLLTGAIGWSGQMRRRAQDVVREQAAKLLEETKQKDRFLATLAHELRNPLAPIRTGLEILQISSGEPGRAAEISEIHGMMRRQVDQLVRLIDDLLDISRINTGKLELRREHVLLADVVRDAVEGARPHLENYGHEFVLSLPDRPITIDADGTRIAQVLLNLLNNAAKFTPEGGRVTLSADMSNGLVELRVRDTGIGIRPQMLPVVFEMFAQADSSLEKSQGGLGIGLTIVKRLVEMHGGTVEARSEGPGRGSEFVVRLPVIDAPHSDHGANLPRPAHLSHAAPRKVLVVDDNVDAARSLEIMLKSMGHTTRTVHDGQEAVQATEEFRPDLILMDLGMPKLNGFDATRLIRKQRSNKDVTIIAVTGWGQEEDRRRSKEAGCDDHVVKPIEFSALSKLLDQAQQTSSLTH